MLKAFSQAMERLDNRQLLINGITIGAALLMAVAGALHSPGVGRDFLWAAVGWTAGTNFYFTLVNPLLISRHNKINDEMEKNLRDHIARVMTEAGFTEEKAEKERLN